MKTVQLSPRFAGQKLSDLLRENEIPFALPCAGCHRCGSCLLVATGALDKPTAAEQRFLSPVQAAAGFRLACFARAMGPVLLSLPNLSALSGLDQALHFAAPAPLMQPGAFGAAIDIGTTTMVVALFASNGGTPLAIYSERNQQQAFGADVISRIQYAIDHGQTALVTAVRSQLTQMLATLCDKAGVPATALTHAVVAANTTMLHFFCGLDTASLGVAPFTPQSLFDETRTDLLPGLSLYLPPCRSAYVGADLLASALDAGFTESDQTRLLADVGTNGEMMLTHAGQAWCCAVAAGPAFESGSRTGSAMVDEVARLLTTGKLSKNGRLAAEVDSLSQREIRNVQLAKAAVRAGITTLLHACNLQASDLDELVLAGVFGSTLDPAAAARIGLIPAALIPRTYARGNGSLAGAARLLLDQSAHEQLRALTARTQLLELSGDAVFQRLFVEQMRF